MEKMKIKKDQVVLFVLGVLCFFISQIVLRIPLLNFLSRNFSFSIFSLRHPVLVSLGVLVSAGLFEEGFRFLFRKFLLRAEGQNEKGLFEFKDSLSRPIIFGLGHGLCEVAYVFSLADLGLSFENYFYIILERFLAVVFHICQTILIFKGFNDGKKYLYLGLAILFHTLFNSLIYLRNQVGILGLYGLFALFDFVYIFLVKKNSYEKKEI